MNIRDSGSSKKLTYLNTEMIEKDQATDNELGFVKIATQEDIKNGSPNKVITAEQLKQIEETRTIKVDGGSF